MRFLKIIALASFFSSLALQAQTEYRNQELSIINENDVYLFQNIDRYYSNGIFLNYRFVPNNAQEDTSQKKRIFDLGIAQRFWTPQNLTLDDPEDYDRPYAGILNLSFETSIFPKKDRRLAYGFDFGVIGKASGAQAFQEWYHKVFGFPQPLGWEYQVPNGAILDLKAEFNRQFFLIPQKVDLISSSSVSLGSGFTNAIQRIDIRAGKLNDLISSAFFNAIIGRGSENIQVHNYFFLGYGLEAVGYNATIQGRLSDSRAEYPYMEDVFRLVRHLRIGFATNSNRVSFKVTYNWLSREVDQFAAGRHAFIGFQLDLRLQSRQ